MTTRASAVAWMTGRLQAAQPDDALSAMPWSLALAAAISLGVITIQILFQGPFATLLIPRTVVFTWTAVVGVASAALGLVCWRLRPRWFPAGLGDAAPGVTAFLWAFNAGLVLLFLPVSLLVWRFDADLMSGWIYPFFSKRWLVALFYCGVATALVLPLAAARLIDAPLENSRPPASTPDRHRYSWLRHLVCTIVLLGIVWYFSGPPWNIERHHRPIDFHEQVHLGPLQAVDKGYLPFVGPASSMYGPGSQVLTYGLMKWSGRFDIVAFRRAQASLHLAAVAVVTLVSYRLMGFWRTLAMLALALTYSPLRFLFPSADGTLAGAYGWGNAWRYLGALLVVPAIALIARAPGRWSTEIGQAFALGVVWGVLSWIAQENLLSTGAAAALTLVLLSLTATCSPRHAVALFSSLCAGCAAVWLLVLAYYGAHGSAGEYLSNYFVVAGAVTMGFQNSWWVGDAGLQRTFWWTAPFLAAVGVCVLWDLRAMRPRRQLGERAVLLVALVCVVLASFQTVLFRSDGAHLTNTMIGLPLVIVLGLWDLPEWSLAGTRARWLARAAGLTVVLWVFPVSQLLLSPVESLLAPPMARLGLPPAAAEAVDTRVPFQRATAALSDEPVVNAGGPAMRTFLEFATDLRALVGTRRVYIAETIGIYSSLYYFIADLTPAPFLGEPETMLIHAARREAALAQMRRRIDEFDCLVVARLDSQEARIFLEAKPGAEVVRRELAATPVFVILGRPSANQGS